MQSDRLFRIVPIGDIAPLLDHLVGAGEERSRYVDAKCLRGLEIDNKVELARLIEGNVARLRTLEDLVDFIGGVGKYVREIDGIGHESADFDGLTKGIDRGRPMLLGKFHSDAPIR